MSKISLGDVAWAASLVDHNEKPALLAMPVRYMTQEQAYSWPLCGIVEREPTKTARWRLTDFGKAVRQRVAQGQPA